MNCSSPLTPEKLIADFKEGVQCFRDILLDGWDMEGVNLKGVEFSSVIFKAVNFRFADLSDIEFDNCRLHDVDFSYANLKGADLSGADLSTCNLTGVIGLASKEEEMWEAKRILDILDLPGNELVMDDWHTCKTVHCIAGWSEPYEEFPGARASTKLPTLTQYFFSDDDTALAAMNRVASGEESVYNR